MTFTVEQRSWVQNLQDNMQQHQLTIPIIGALDVLIYESLFLMFINKLILFHAANPVNKNSVC